MAGALHCVARRRVLRLHWSCAGGSVAAAALASLAASAAALAHTDLGAECCDGGCCGSVAGAAAAALGVLRLRVLRWMLRLLLLRLRRVLLRRRVLLLRLVLRLRGPIASGHGITAELPRRHPVKVGVAVASSDAPEPAVHPGLEAVALRRRLGDRQDRVDAEPDVLAKRLKREPPQRME
jgi:hypothetical protein